MKSYLAILTLIVFCVFTSCGNPEVNYPYAKGQVTGKHTRQEGDSLAYVIVFSYQGVFTARHYSAIVPKESYDNMKLGDFVELKIEKGKKK